jgi:hypothetical protein
MTQSTDKIRSEVKTLASEIESLAQTVQNQIATTNVVLDASSELVKSSLKLTFAIGQLYGVSTVKKVSATKAVRTTANYHNIRDNRGRFTRK